MKVIDGKNYWEKRDVLERYPFSERTFFTRIKRYKDKYHKDMTKKYSYWCINENVVPIVFKMYRRPSLNDLNRVKKWVSLYDWNLIGNISPRMTNMKGNEEIIEYFFENIKKRLNRDVEMVYCIENNPSLEKNPNKEYFHTHFLIKIDITNSEYDELKTYMYNVYPNSDLKFYNDNLGDSGKEYTTKHMDKNLERFGFLNYRK